MKNQNRRDFLKTKGSAALSPGPLYVLSSLSLTGCRPGKKKRPNIILINTDDLGYAGLGCYGQKLIRKFWPLPEHWLSQVKPDMRIFHQLKHGIR